jgi:hypothetical protein
MISALKLLVLSMVLLLSFSLRISAHGVGAQGGIVAGGYNNINVDKLTDDEK